MAAATMSVQRALFRLEEVNKVVAGSSEIDLWRKTKGKEIRTVASGLPSTYEQFDWWRRVDRSIFSDACGWSAALLLISTRWCFAAFGALFECAPIRFPYRLLRPNDEWRPSIWKLSHPGERAVNHAPPATDPKGTDADTGAGVVATPAGIVLFWIEAAVFDRQSVCITARQQTCCRLASTPLHRQPAAFFLGDGVFACECVRWRACRLRVPSLCSYSNRPLWHFWATNGPSWSTESTCPASSSSDGDGASAAMTW